MARIWPILSLLVVCGVYGLIAFTSHGYDDEIYNIAIVEHATSIASIVDTINHEDVHPPGQYVINFTLVKDAAKVDGIVVN